MALYKNQAAYDQVCSARMVMNGKLPYMRPTTMGLIPIEHPGLGTVAVSDRMQFLYDPEFMLKLTDPLVQAGVMFHEVLHVLKNHALRGRALGIDEQAPQWMRTLWNYAGDMENNRDVDAAGLKLPDFMTPIRIGNFKDTKGQPFPQNGTAEEFYRLLCENRAQEQADQQKQKDDQQQEKDEGSDDDAGDDQPESGDDSDDGDGSESGDDDGEPGDESGDDGAGDDDNAPGDDAGEGEGSDDAGEGSDDNAPGKAGGASTDAGNAGKGAGQGSDAPGQGSDDAGEGAGQGSGNSRTPAPKAHVGGGACGSCAANKVDGEDAHAADPGKAESEVQAARSLTKAAIQEHVSRMGRGSVPGGLAVWAEKPDAPLPVPFWKLIRTTVTKTLTWAQGKANLRFNRPSRKQAGLGYGQGRAVMPALASPVPKMAIGVDSSGSMGTADVSVALSVVELAIRNTNTKVTFFSCDTKVNAMQKVSRWQDAVKLIHGGGGTDFRPVFAAVAAMPIHERPDILIFVTDGQGPAPKIAPPNMKVVWLLVGTYATSPCDWGDQIFVEENALSPN